MYTAYRLNDANEIMPPHRHSPSAIRFGLKGKGNFTGVDGENIMFGPGDMVLTPNDTWHNHGTVGNEQALNLSVLDLPLVETLNAIHFEHDYKEEENGKLVSKKEQTRALPIRLFAAHLRLWRPAAALRRHASRAAPAIPRRCSSIAGRWCANCSTQHKDRDGDRMRADGRIYRSDERQPVFKTITFFAQMLQPGQKTLPVRTTASLLVVPVRRQRVFGGRRQAVRLEGIRHARDSGRFLVRAPQQLRRQSRCSCSSPATSRH